MNALRLLAAGVVVCVATAHVTAEEKKDNAKALVGSWEATKADPMTLPVGAVVTFAKDGKMKVTHKVEDKDMTFEGTYKVDGDKFMIVLKIGDNEEKLTITIKKISDTELVTANAEGKVVEFKKKK
jgi:uncharacterized protein (TIGR03066 family)